MDLGEISFQNLELEWVKGKIFTTNELSRWPERPFF